MTAYPQLQGFLEGKLSLKEALLTEDPWQRDLLSLCDSEVPFDEKLRILSELKVEGQFQNDLRGLSLNLRNRNIRSDYPFWTIVDSDDPCDLFLAGTEVEGSCQNVNGEPYFNKCLLGYVLDGKNRILAIKDETGRMRGRAMMRLLWDGTKPILFLSRIYPAALNPLLDNALLTFAKKRASHLGVSLLSFAPGEPDPVLAKSLGSPAPYEYVDEAGGITDGKWSITGNLLTNN